MTGAIPSTNDYESWPLLKRLVGRYVRPHMSKVVNAVICMVIVAAMTAASAYMMKPILDDIFLGERQDLLFITTVSIILIFTIKGVASYGQDVLLGFLGQRIVSNMQIELFSHLMKSDIGTFHEETTGRLISRFTNDIMMMRNAVSGVLTGAARELLSMVFLIAMMIYQSWELSLIAVLLYPLAFYPIAKLGRRMRKVSKTTQEQLGQFTSQLDETFSGVRMVKAYNREGYEISRADAIIEHLFKLYYKAIRVQSAASPIMETLGGLAIAGVVYYGGLQVMQNDTTPGAFFSFITAMMLAYKPAKSLANLNTSLQQGLAAAHRFFLALDMEPTIKDTPDAKTLALHKGAISFEGVTFHYPGSHAGVHNISFEIPAGKTVALVGPSGSGKSTLINLILRFYEAETGSIRVDGQNIKNVTLASLRNQMALVSQEIVLFDDTVRSNIAYGRDGASEADIIEAAKSAAADEFIRELPQGYDTIIGSHGVKLSGGQRQRLAIARAMLKNAPILLLDEATSALDTTSERQVQEALTRLMQHRTTLVIAHRLSTIQQADEIFVLQSGRIVESGSHSNLLKTSGLYAKLYHAQFETVDA